MIEDISDVIETLLGIGKSILYPDSFRMPDIRGVGEFCEINRSGIALWGEVAHGLTDEEVACLMLGMAFAEEKYQWEGGSVAGAVILFRILVARKADRSLLDKVSRWALENNGNAYVPFGGSNRLGAKTYSEYLELIEQRSKNRAKIEADEHAAAEERKRKRRKMAYAAARERNSVKRK